MLNNPKGPGTHLLYTQTSQSLFLLKPLGHRVYTMVLPQRLGLKPQILIYILIHNIGTLWYMDLTLRLCPKPPQPEDDIHQIVQQALGLHEERLGASEN